MNILICSYNKLTYLPKTIYRLINLRWLDIEHNEITKLPKTFGKLIDLQYLYCSFNQITKLPNTIGNLVNLQGLSCNHNNLTSLPPEIGGLKALQDFTALGSGFQVALKDLEIRGAGNLLGKEQSGHIAVIGFKLYCQLLEKAVKKKKGIAVYEEVPVQCMLPITLEIPSHYVIEAELRLHLYRRINMIKNVKQAGEMRKELVDRFGLIPDTTENLIHLTVIKQKAMRKKVDAIMWQKGLLILRSQDKIIYREKLDIIEGQESIILNKIEKILERLPNLI